MDNKENIEPEKTSGAKKAILDKYFKERELYELFHGMFTILAIDQPDRPLDYLSKALARLKASPETMPEISRMFFQPSFPRADLETYDWIGRRAPRFPGDLPVTSEKSPRTRELIDNAIRNDPILGTQIEEPYNLLMNVMAERKISAGEILFSEGDSATSFCVIETGKFRISNGDKTEVLNAGESFNSKALLYTQKQKSTATALEPGTLWTMDRVSFNRVLADLAYRKRKLYEGILRSIPILSTLTEDQITNLAMAMEATEFSDGEIVFCERGYCEELFIIISGTAIVSKGSDTTKELHSGLYFGEQALLGNSTSPFAVVARGKLKCAKITRSSFQKVFGPPKETSK